MTDRKELGLNIDMTDADRLRAWARLIEVYGDRISNWGDSIFVSVKLRDIADRLADEVRDVGELRAALAAHCVQCPQCQALALRVGYHGTVPVSEAGRSAQSEAQEQKG